MVCLTANTETATFRPGSDETVFQSSQTAKSRPSSRDRRNRRPETRYRRETQTIIAADDGSNLRTMHHSSNNNRSNGTSPLKQHSGNVYSPFPCAVNQSCKSTSVLHLGGTEVVTRNGLHDASAVRKEQRLCVALPAATDSFTHPHFAHSLDGKARVFTEGVPQCSRTVSTSAPTLLQLRFPPNAQQGFSGPLWPSTQQGATSPTGDDSTGTLSTRRDNSVAEGALLSSQPLSLSASQTSPSRLCISTTPQQHAVQTSKSTTQGSRSWGSSGEESCADRESSGNFTSSSCSPSFSSCSSNDCDSSSGCGGSSRTAAVMPCPSSAGGSRSFQTGTGRDSQDYLYLYKHLPKVSSQTDLDRLARSMHALCEGCFYYSDLDSDGARALLQDAAEGTFLVRDSSDSRFLFALTVKTARGATSVRIQYHRGFFQLDCEDQMKRKLPRFETMLELLDFHVAMCRDKQGGQYRWLESSKKKDMVVKLSSPRRHSPPSLFHQARVALNRQLEDLHLPSRSTDLLPLPCPMKSYLRAYPYKV